MLYGKWRPRGFDEVVGQDHVVATLRNALITDQVAHAYLFSGPRGTGKTTTARILAKAVNCRERREGDPCNACRACEAINRGAALDLIEMDAASNRGIDDVRELRDKIAFAPSDLDRKVYLLDEVHMLTTGAFNALLKTLEEPPPHAIFILATTELHELPPTIVSRCQRFDFRRVPVEAMVERLGYIAGREGYAVPEEGLLAIAKEARGALRDAITLLEQIAAAYGPAPGTDDVLEGLGLVRDERTERLAEALAARDLGAALALAREVAADGLDIARFTRETIDTLRERLLAAARERAPEVETLTAAVAELAGADFRRDPGNPVPLEVACAAAVLGPARAVAPAPATPATGGERGGGGGQREERPRRPARPRRSAGGASGEERSREQRFLDDLYTRCKAAQPTLAAWLNGSCEVVSAISENSETTPTSWDMDGDELKLGFYHPIHLQKIANDGRTLVEQQASELLKRPVTLAVERIEKAAPARPPAKGGHLAKAARDMGAKPVDSGDGPPPPPPPPPPERP